MQQIVTELFFANLKAICSSKGAESRRNFLQSFLSFCKEILLTAFHLEKVNECLVECRNVLETSPRTRYLSSASTHSTMQGNRISSKSLLIWLCRLFSKSEWRIASCRVVIAIFWQESLLIAWNRKFRTWKISTCATNKCSFWAFCAWQNIKSVINFCILLWELLQLPKQKGKWKVKVNLFKENQQTSFA